MGYKEVTSLRSKMLMSVRFRQTSLTLKRDIREQEGVVNNGEGPSAVMVDELEGRNIDSSFTNYK